MQVEVLNSLLKEEASANLFIQDATNYAIGVRNGKVMEDHFIDVVNAVIMPSS